MHREDVSNHDVHMQVAVQYLLHELLTGESGGGGGGRERRDTQVTCEYNYEYATYLPYLTYPRPRIARMVSNP